MKKKLLAIVAAGLMGSPLVAQAALRHYDLIF